MEMTATKTIVRSTDDSPATWTLNGLMLTMATLDETGGAYALSEHLITAACNPPVHMHTDEEEAFYVLDGEIDFEVDGNVIHATTGSFTLIPRGAVHTFRVISDTARVLNLASAPQGAPGGGTEHFFTAVGEPARERVIPTPAPPDLALVGQVAASCGIELLGPPPA
jgi:quercetin dioxygenase-like cupin family protein